MSEVFNGITVCTDSRNIKITRVDKLYDIPLQGILTHNDKEYWFEAEYAGDDLSYTAKTIAEIQSIVKTKPLGDHIVLIRLIHDNDNLPDVIAQHILPHERLLWVRCYGLWPTASICLELRNHLEKGVHRREITIASDSQQVFDWYMELEPLTRCFRVPTETLQKVKTFWDTPVSELDFKKQESYRQELDQQKEQVCTFYSSHVLRNGYTYK